MTKMRGTALLIILVDVKGLLAWGQTLHSAANQGAFGAPDWRKVLGSAATV